MKFDYKVLDGRSDRRLPQFQSSCCEATVPTTVLPVQFYVAQTVTCDRVICLTFMWYNRSGSWGSCSFSQVSSCSPRLRKHSDLRLMKAERCSCAASFLSLSSLRCSTAKLANRFLSSPLKLSSQVEERPQSKAH